MTLSANDRQLVQQMIDDFYGQRQNVLEHKEGFLHQAPETYIAKIPSGGIDPVVCDPSGGETVTGVSCVLYKILPDNTMEATGFSRTIYNVGVVKVSEDVCYVPVTRTKYGKWVQVSNSPVSVFKSLVHFTLDADMATGDSSEEATITSEGQYGPGENNPDTAITVLNLLTSQAGVYVFKGDEGDAGLAIRDTEQEYKIIQMQCPTNPPV